LINLRRTWHNWLGGLDMARFLLNDASLHGQFATSTDVVLALQRVYDIRKELQKQTFELRVHSRIAERPATATENLRTSLFNSNSRDLKNLILAWFNGAGSFWDNPPQHDPDEYFECNNTPVTETGLAEAAMFAWLEGVDETDTASLSPSNFTADPLRVDWLERKGVNLDFSIRNHTGAESLPARLVALEKPVQNWKELLERLRRKCPNLLYSPDIPTQLGLCFYPNVANQSLMLLRLLNDLVALKRAGNETRYNEQWSNLMVGKEARFTDSSDSEIKDFANKMTFTHPFTGKNVFCSWHGKIQTPLYRIHIEWPMPEKVYRKEKESDEYQPLLVAYIGPKLTKR
jgi:hypothetical protein